MEVRWSTTSVCTVSFRVASFDSKQSASLLGSGFFFFNSCILNWKILLYTNEPKKFHSLQSCCKFFMGTHNSYFALSHHAMTDFTQFFYGDLVAHAWWNGDSCFCYLILNDSWHVSPFMFIGLINIFCQNWRSHYKLDI